MTVKKCIFIRRKYLQKGIYIESYCQVYSISYALYNLFGNPFRASLCTWGHGTLDLMWERCDIPFSCDYTMLYDWRISTSKLSPLLLYIPLPSKVRLAVSGGARFLRFRASCIRAFQPLYWPRGGGKCAWHILSTSRKQGVRLLFARDGL